MKDKIGVLDDVNKKLEGVMQKSKEREAFFGEGNSRSLTIKSAIDKLKVIQLPLFVKIHTHMPTVE